MLKPLRTRFLIVQNPRAGWYRSRLFGATLDKLSSAGASFEITRPSDSAEGTQRIEAAARSGAYDAIIAAGGDGTIHGVVGGLIGSSTPLGIIPTGTSNVFAHEIGLDSTPSALAQTLLHGTARDVPVGQVNGEPFVFIVGVGFDAEAVRHFEAAEMRHLGRASYVLPVLRALSQTPGRRSLVVTTENGRSRAHWVIVTRVKHYAANLLLAAEADFRSPLFYVIRFGEGGRFALMRQLAALMTHLLPLDPEVSIEAVKRVTIDGDASCPVQIDGEFKGKLPIDIRLHAKRINLICPIKPGGTS